MQNETVFTHFVISLVATIPAILAGIAGVLVSLRQLKQGKETHKQVNGRVDQLLQAREHSARLDERLRHLEQTYGSDHPIIASIRTKGEE